MYLNESDHRDMSDTTEEDSMMDRVGIRVGAVLDVSRAAAQSIAVT